MSKTCKQCGQGFEVTEGDLGFYEKMEVPSPQMCPDCRAQKRFVYRNEWGMYRDKCGKCETSMISMYPPNQQRIAYCEKCWWSDEFDPLDYGQEFDFTRPFFEQMDELMRRCPLPRLVIGDCENSDYCNYAWKLKNCYLVTASDYSEDCMYCTYAIRSKDCMDCTYVNDCELCYQCLDTKASYQSFYLQNCSDCRDCWFCADCNGCSDCLGCTGLRKGQYCIFNKKYSAEEYELKKAEFFEKNKDLEGLRRQFDKVKLKFPHKNVTNLSCEDCEGDHLVSSKGCENSFDLVECEDCKNCAFGLGAKDCVDCTGVTPAELCYECCAVPDNYFLKFCMVIWPKASYLEYCILSRSSNHCFGGVSLHKNEYCILNKQYTKEEYEEMILRIKEHMKKTGEYGELFPISIAPFPYNTGLAQDYYPLIREEIDKNGWPYYEEVEKKYEGDSDGVIICKKTKKPFRLMEKERKFYKKFGLALPEIAPLQRHRDRVEMRNPRKLWNRKCEKCEIVVKSSYEPGRPEKVFCEKCYLGEVY